mgnify:FL=1
MKRYIFLIALLVFSSNAYSQKKKKDKKNPLDETSVSALKWRAVGPALTSGRVSDLAVNPNNPFEYYVAIASGGVWKTSNWGVDYKPIFDGQSSYSIGCVTIDPNNTNIVWVGTGENNNQRSVAYGDGVYKSVDGGASWKNMGLKNSEHIGNILVHPDNSDVVYVSAYGPLWSKGGDRGIYKTEDGGKTWNNILNIDEHTGFNEIHMDPRNPDVLYAASHQRRRHVYTYVGGGPGSGLHKSVDGGKSWKEINKGLPSVEIGRIGMDISDANPEIIYAIVEAAERKGGFYKSTNRGETWVKQSSKVTSGNYYQEIFADPVDEDIVYIMDTWMAVTHDGGKTFKNVGEDYKHVDNHAMWINPNNNMHWLVGCDGGIYETFDSGKKWDFKKNLPVTQFYKVAVDNAEPFYNIYGGTQDNFSIGGPSRVNNSHGISNQDWFITHGGDGFESQIDPENPNIVYAQSQYGWLVRYDKLSGEEVGIKPIARKGELDYKWNWDAPLAVSNHKSGRLYFAANKVFRSDDYGNSWSVISDDLSRKIDRNKLKVYDRVLSIDAVAKNGSTSPYGTIVALSESPIDEDFIVIGTDDGLIQITENSGKSWRKVDDIKGAPKQSYVNSVYLSQHDINVIYVAFNHHKFGDFKPYVFKSSDKGMTWESISNNLPIKGSVYSIEEDHIDSSLIFCGTEFGVFFSPDSGGSWKELANGLPTIAVRDIAIQRRENDLVLGTFGRGFYVLDDYSVLRSIENLDTSIEAKIFDVRDALMWEKAAPLGLPGKAFQGDNFYLSENLDPVAIFTYNYDKKYESLKSKRQKAEKKLINDENDVDYPTYSELYNEINESKPELVFTIRDSENRVVKKIYRKLSKGLSRFHWNLRYEDKNPINLSSSSFYNPFAGVTEGTLVNPGTYSVDMSILKAGTTTKVVEAKSFNIVALNNTVMPADDRKAKVEFQRKVSMLQAEISEYSRKLSEISNKMPYVAEAVKKVEQPIDKISKMVWDVKETIKDVNLKFYGDNVKRRLDIQTYLSPSSRLGAVAYYQKYSTAAPTKTHMDSYEIAKEEFEPIKVLVNKLKSEMKMLEKILKESGAPYTPGRPKAIN